MVNEEQLLKAYISTMIYYERKFRECENEYEYEKYMLRLADLDVKIYDMILALGYDPTDFDVYDYIKKK